MNNSTRRRERRRMPCQRNLRASGPRGLRCRSKFSSAIADADSLLSGFAGKLPYNVSTSATGQAMTNDSSVLESYNNGLLSRVVHPKHAAWWEDRARPPTTPLLEGGTISFAADRQENPLKKEMEK